MSITFLQLFVYSFIMVSLGFAFGYFVAKHKRLDKHYREKHRLDNALRDAALRYDISANEVMRLRDWSSIQFEIWEYDEIKKRGGIK